MIQTDPDDEILATDIDEGEVGPPLEEETQDLVPLRPKKNKEKKGKSKGKKSAKKSEKKSTKAPKKVKAKKESKAKKTRAAKPKAPKAEKPASGDSSKKPRGCGRRLDGKPRRARGTNPPKTEAAGRLGRKIAKARGEKEWSQKMLAEKLGVTQPGIANIERGVAPPSEELQEKIFKALGIAS